MRFFSRIFVISCFDSQAKERKQEILRLREDLKETQGSSLILFLINAYSSAFVIWFWVFFLFVLDSDASHCDLFPESASCKCYFFDNLGRLSPKFDGNASSNNRFNDVLRRRFLRQGIINFKFIIIIIMFLLFFVVVLCFWIAYWRWKFAFCSAI
jgi:hypothetical protein